MTETLQTKIAEFFDLLGVRATIQVDLEELDDRKYFNIKVQAAEAGAEIIGRHGSIIEALATVITMMVPRSEERYGILLDINGYRDERSKYLQDMATKAIDEVVNSQQPVSLQPMKPWERRVVHMSVVGRTDVITTSEGEEPERRVVIRPAA